MSPITSLLFFTSIVIFLGEVHSFLLKSTLSKKELEKLNYAFIELPSEQSFSLDCSEVCKEAGLVSCSAKPFLSLSPSINGAYLQRKEIKKGKVEFHKLDKKKLRLKHSCYCQMSTKDSLEYADIQKQVLPVWDSLFKSLLELHENILEINQIFTDYAFLENVFQMEIHTVSEFLKAHVQYRVEFYPNDALTSHFKYFNFYWSVKWMEEKLSGLMGKLESILQEEANIDKKAFIKKYGSFFKSEKESKAIYSLMVKKRETALKNLKQSMTLLFNLSQTLFATEFIEFYSWKNGRHNCENGLVDPKNKYPDPATQFKKKIKDYPYARIRFPFKNLSSCHEVCGKISFFETKRRFFRSDSDLIPNEEGVPNLGYDILLDRQFNFLKAELLTPATIQTPIEPGCLCQRSKNVAEQKSQRAH